MELQYVDLRKLGCIQQVDPCIFKKEHHEKENTENVHCS